MKIAHSHRGSAPHLTHDYLGPPSIGSTVFAGLTNVTDRQTDRQTDRPRYSVGSNRLHLRMLYCNAA